MADTAANSEGAEPNGVEQERTPRVQTLRLVADVALFGVNSDEIIEVRVEDIVRRALLVDMGECAVTVALLGSVSEDAEVGHSTEALLVARALVADGWSRKEVIALRKARRMSVRGFAGHIGVSDRAVSYWEQEEDPHPPNAKSQAKFLDSLVQAGPVIWLRFIERLDISQMKANEARLDLIQRIAEDLTASARRSPEEETALRTEILELIRRLGAPESKVLSLALQIFTIFQVINNKDARVLKHEIKAQRDIEAQDTRELHDMDLLQLEGMEEAADRRDVATMFAILQQAGISQQRIAFATGLRQSDISSMLRTGRVVRHVDVLERICDGFGFPRAAMGLGRAQDI